MVLTKKIEAGCLLLLALLAVSSIPGFAQAKNPPDAPATSTPQTSPTDQPKPSGGGGGRRHGGGADTADSPNAKPEKNAYDYYLPGADGKDIPLSNFKGKYILVVNLGRKSSYNDQLPGLIKLNDTYKSKGLVVIGVPSNEFGAAEPGTGAEIQKAYTDAKVDFLVTGVSKLTGDDALPFYLYLTKGKSAPAGGPVAWNYTKFIVDKKGNVIARLDPDAAPDSPEMLATIDQVLDGTYKPKKEGGKSGAAAGPSSDSN
jgi:glutathione peroxidase